MPNLIKYQTLGFTSLDQVTLNNGENDEFGKEAINTLVAELENRRNSLMVIVAGYADKMERFLDVNQGLASRLSNEIVFDDYTDDELTEIFSYMIEQKHFQLEDGTLDAVRELISQKRQKMKDFGNARGVRNLMERIEMRKNSRVAALSRKGGSITPEDFIFIKKEDIM